MKSKLWIIPALILCLVSCLAFTACGDGGADVEVTGAELDLKYVEAKDGVPEHFDVIGIIEGDKNTNLIIPDMATYKYTVEKEVLDAEGNPMYDDNGEPVITSVTEEREIPVMNIVERAFYNNSVVENIEIGNNVVSIGNRAFDSCTSAKSIKIGTGIATIPEKAFTNCTALSSITIPKTVKSIGVSSFEGCVSLSAVAFEDEGLTSIATRAFYGCSSIESIKIPKSVTFIDVDAFTLCEKILDRATKEENGLTVFDDSITYVDSWIVAWDMEHKTSHNVVVRDGTYGIAALAFASDALHPIDTITFPASVHSAVDNAFEECMIVKAIAPAPVFRVIPLDTLESAVVDGGNVVEDGSFKGAPRLVSVEIRGNVSTIGKNAFAGCKKLEEIKIDANTSVKEILDSAFKDCTKITSFDVTSGCTKIESSAFQGCSSLADVNVRNVKSIGDFAFAYCDSLVSFTVPNSATALGEWVFFNCTSLASVVLPAELTKVPAHLFHGCTALAEINVPESVTEIGEYAFSECDALVTVAIPAGVTNISDALFAGCDSLTTVTASSVTSIGNYSFYRCSALAGFEIPAVCQSIGTSAFEGCLAITSIVIPESVKTLGSYVFYECESLVSITLPTAIESVGKKMFDGCTAVEYTVEGGCYYLGSAENKYLILVKIDEAAFGGINNNTKIIGSGVFEYTQLTSITIPASVVQIGEGAFAYCNKLTSINLPEGLTSIGNNAFQGCSAITSIEIPASLKAISNYAFSGCSELAQITLNGDISIGRFAFENCTKFEELVIAYTIVHIDDYAFSGCDSLWSIEIAEIGTSASYAFFGTQIEKATLSAEAFAGMDTSTLKEVVITSGKLGKKVFEGCANLEKVTILEGVTEVDATAFDGCDGIFEIIDGVVYVDTWVVDYQNKVNSEKSNSLPYVDVTIREGTLGLSTTAFAMITKNVGGTITYSVSLIKNLTIPESVKYYSDSTFDNAYIKGANVAAHMLGAFKVNRLETLTVTSGEIAENALKDCQKLYFVTIGEGVTAIGDNAFKGCDKLVEVCNLSALEITKKSSDFGQVAKNAINVYGNEGQSILAITDTDLVYMKNGSNIEVVAFASDANDLVLPAKIEGKDYSVYKYAFYYCANIFTVTLEEGANITIGDYAFYESAYLTTITFKGNVTKIGAYAFNSAKLGFVYMAYAPLTIGTNALPTLTQASNLRICYQGSADDFKNFNANIRNATYSYSAEKPSSDGRFWHYDSKGAIAIWPKTGK